MARSLSNVKFLVASLVDDLSLPIFRRGYAAGAGHGLVLSGGGGSRTGIVRKVEEMGVMMKEDSRASAWAPDPITGYYRPANRTAEIDPVDLRQMLLQNRVRSL